LVVAGCESTATSSTTVGQPQVSTSQAATSATSSSAPSTTTDEGLDLTGSLWVTIGLDGLQTDKGEVLWPSGALFDKAVARDHAGGLVFIDGSDLWWFATGTPEPLLVADNVPTRVVEVIGSGTDAVAALGYEERTYLRLSDGANMPDPGGVVTIETDGQEVWSAANGWSVWIEGPELAPTDEGTPTVVESQARLKVADADGVVVIDEVVGTDTDPWVRIHDFDGQIVILSRGPIEPAMPEETFLVIDLGCAACTSTFTAAAASASLVEADRDWSGPLEFSEDSLD
jgi:hypothetical protein